METRAHYVAIGSFTLLVITAAFAFVFWFRGTDGRGTTTNYRIVFTGSVSGLSKGSLVMYNGLKVGEVTSLSLMADDPSRVVAVATVDASTPMNTDTKARLEFQGLTGVASIQLSGGGPNSQKLVSADPSKPPIIYADRSDFQDLLESAQRLAKKAEDVLTQADRLFSVNAGAINATVRNVFVIGPDKAIKLILVYPMSTGRNFDEILRVIDSMQLTAKHKVATPADWKQGEDVIIVPAVDDETAKGLFPDGWDAQTPYLRVVKQPG